VKNPDSDREALFCQGSGVTGRRRLRHTFPACYSPNSQIDRFPPDNARSGPGWREVGLVADVFTPEKRSAVMAAIRGGDTGPELKVRSIVHNLGYRFRLRVRELPGSPDLVLPRLRTVIFVHGCFWHRHEGCRHATTPSTRRSYWQDKFAANMARDRRVVRRLRRLGWSVLTVWECQLRQPQRVRRRLARLLANRGEPRGVETAG
jgi:DNA mismatch endonuclease (patch repair protein)